MNERRSVMLRELKASVRSSDPLTATKLVLKKYSRTRFFKELQNEAKILLLIRRESDRRKARASAK